MTRLFIDGFETSKCSPFWDQEFGQPWVAAKAGMSGSYCLGISNATGYLTFDSNKTEIYLACKIWNESGTVSNPLFEFRDSAETYIASIILYGSILGWEIRVKRGNYNATQIDSGGWVNYQTTHLLEVRIKPLDTGGIIQVKIDGVQVINYSGDTTAGLENIKSMHWGTHGGVQAAFYTVDDIVIDDANWIGNTRVQKLQISGAGTTTEWDASAGNPYECIDEIPYSDSDWVETNVVDESLTCACADMTGNIDSVKCVEVYGRMAYEGNPTPTKQKIAIRVNGSEYYGDDEGTALGYGLFGKRWELNPDDAAAWEEADINAIEIGVRSVT